MDDHFVRECLKRYRAALTHIAGKRGSRDYLLYGDPAGELKNLEFRAGRFMGMALRAGYDPVKDIALYHNTER